MRAGVERGNERKGYFHLLKGEDGVETHEGSFHVAVRIPP